MQGTTARPAPLASLVEALQRGEAEAFEVFFRAQRDPLLRLGRRLLRCEVEAEDCFQEVMLKIPLAIGDFDGRASLTTWTWRIMRNACLMRLRRRRRRPEVLGTEAPSRASIAPDADRGLEASDCCRVVRAALARLPAHYREILWLRDFEELSTAEAAASLGISVVNAKVRLHRARAALREDLERTSEEAWLTAYRRGL